MHDLYFEPKYEEFRPRTIWSLSNAFTSAFKELEPIPQFKATAKLGEFLETRFSMSFSGRGGIGRPPLFRGRQETIHHAPSTAFMVGEINERNTSLISFGARRLLRSSHHVKTDRKAEVR